MTDARTRRIRVALAGAVVALLAVVALVSPVLCTAGWAEEPAPVAAPDVPVRQLERDAAASAPEPPLPGARVADEAGVDGAGVLAELEEIAAPAAVSLDAVVLDEDGRTLLTSPSADRSVPSASLVKLLVVQQLLARSAAGELALGPADPGRMERAITVSDDRAMSLLWDAHDGARLVRDAATAFGLTATAPPEVPGQWGEASTSSADVARFLGRVSADPGATGGHVLLLWMRGAVGTAADGFDQRFGFFAAGPEAGAAVKQGWMCCVAGQRHLHSVGVLGDGRVVALLAEAPAYATWAQVRRAVDDAAAALVAGTA
ncbi:hypothetical protein [Modestobacter roseus]|uniref:Beta-lactamase family protein n=1 Tax=Modestobacter roseus TaxID=1181884 RepID=A0A562IXA5_9ACTN|nr:hypothetical protein [Modestobacter roseus]MQA33924.1 hypothetical protein [Modestobacter roseus]TWH75470.1 hypothetical protein JD78_04031 [Modestobacter roseus]